MADMAEISQVEDAWEQLVNLGLTDDEGSGITPITYMNSTAAIKAFCGERGGMVCTSSNAKGAFEWALRRNGKIFFLPDQHLGRNTGYARGIPLDEMVVWDPYMLQGGQTAERLRKAKVILWKGHCSVHQRFLPEHVDKVRANYPGIQVIVHPECRWEVCQKADGIGSTDYLIKVVRQAPAGIVVRHRHRNPPDQPPGEGKSGQARHHARRFRLPVHDHVPHLAATLVLGAGKPGGRQHRQSDQGKRQREEVGTRGA